MPVHPPRTVTEIPSEDQDRYRSRVTAVRPEIPELEAEVVGGQEKLRVRWTGRQALTVLGFSGEPMIRMSARGIEINTVSPSTYLSAERYGQVPVPVRADPRLDPQWRYIDTAGTISWFDHRIHWLKAERPRIVGDGSKPVTIFHWAVPARLGGKRVEIRGVLDWLPQARAVRDMRSEISSPVLSATILAGVFAGGWLVGIALRRRKRIEA